MKASVEREDFEDQVVVHSSKLETAVSKFSVLNDPVTELGADLQLKMDAMRVDEQEIFANEYFDKLEPDCMNSGSTHADRAAARELVEKTTDHSMHAGTRSSNHSGN